VPEDHAGGGTEARPPRSPSSGGVSARYRRGPRAAAHDTVGVPRGGGANRFVHDPPRPLQVRTLRRPATHALRPGGRPGRAERSRVRRTVHPRNLRVRSGIAGPRRPGSRGPPRENRSACKDHGTRGARSDPEEGYFPLLTAPRRRSKIFLALRMAAVPMRFIL